MDDVIRSRGNRLDGRSPEIDYDIQGSLRAVFAELLTKKGLYQNVRLNLDVLSQYADDETTMEDFVSEFTTRPVNARSHGEGDDELLTLRAGRHGGSPSGGPGVGEHHELTPLSFYLPNITSDCPECQKTTPYLSRSDSYASYYGSNVPPPITRGDPLHQHFNLFYRCSDCSQHVLAFQVIRDGLRYQLTGRSIPYRPKIDDAWPKPIKNIVQDAVAANAENDVPAAYYHLRTALEHYIKQELKIALAEKVEGTVLCDRYNAVIDNRLKSNFPSASGIYTTLSLGLHTREVSSDEFDSLRGQLLDHFKGKLLFDKYSQQPRNQ